MSLLLRHLRIGAIAVSFGSALLPGIASAQATDSRVNIVASISKFTPALLQTHVGEKTTIHFTSAEGVHGVKSSELDIAATTIMPSGAIDVTFTPKKAGTYAIYCTMPCGDGHEDMKLTVVVTDN